MLGFIVILLLISSSCLAQESNTDDKIKSILEKEIHFSVGISLNTSDSCSHSKEIPDFDSMFYDQAILKLPEGYSDDGKPVRLVYMAHGAGGGVTSEKWFWNSYSITDSLLKNGYACFDVNGGPSIQNMGGCWVTQSAFKAYEYIKNHYNVYDKIFVFGGSMGGLSSTNFIYNYSSIVLAHGMYSPVLDLYEQAWNNPWSATTRFAISKVFNFIDKTGRTWESEKVIGWNPLFTGTFNNGIDTFKIYPVPVKIWHGNTDSVVRINSSRQFKRYILNAGEFCELHELESDDHGLSCGNGFMNRELLLFLKKFDE